MKVGIIFDIPDDCDIERCTLGGDKNIYYEREGEPRTSIIANIANAKLEKITDAAEKSKLNAAFLDQYFK